MELDRKKVGERISRIMQAAGMNQQQLATHLGISQPAVSLYLQGRIPPPEVLYQLALLGNTSMEWILTGKEERDISSGKVREASSAYHVHARLLKLWEQLSPELRQDLLRLIEHILQNSQR
ncbi:MAG: helix-turn-helix domain-containing protein [Calditrichaeota bacterium]|nr:MAG: helix-turn-helix domain-containing protein [Calditrichota bacterium]